jgi:hypothetical protein
MYAVELRFVTNDEVAIPSELVEPGLRAHGAAHPTVRLEHLRVRRVGGETYVVAFVSAPTVAEAEAFARTAGQHLAAELRHLLFVGFRTWTEARPTRRGNLP